MKIKNSEAILKIAKPIGGLHGISAIFPKFDDVINYEEQKIIMNRGYPRFVTHPFVKKIENLYKKKFNAIDVLSCHSFESAIFLVLNYYFKVGIRISDNNGLVDKFFKYFSNRFPGIISKTRVDKADIIITNDENFKPELKTDNQVLITILKDPSQNFIEYYNIIDILIIHDKVNDIGLLLFYNKKIPDLTLLRRHTGLIPSSRKIFSKKSSSEQMYLQRREQLKVKLSKLELTYSDNCFLFPSGMAAVFFAVYTLISPKKSRFIALGSLYVDTIRILEKWPKNYNLKDTLFITKDFENQLKLSIDKDTAGVILEFPSNPLLQLIDLEKIVKIAH
ncbi:MAG: PLP-dependent transferase, partial [Promethearchaeota archaeon]